MPGWADLLKRVFAWEVLGCACGATRWVMAAVQAGPVAEKIWRHLGLPTEWPVPTPARSDPQGELWETGRSVDEFSLLSLSKGQAGDEFDQRLADSHKGMKFQSDVE